MFLLLPMSSQYTISTASPVSTPYHLPVSSQYIISAVFVQLEYHLNAHIQSECHISYLCFVGLLHVLLMSSQYIISPNHFLSVYHLLVHVQSVHNLTYPCPVSTQSSTHVLLEYHLFYPLLPVRILCLMPISSLQSAF